MQFIDRNPSMISKCPFCGRFDSEADVKGCVPCEALGKRLRELLPPEYSIVEALDEFYNGPMGGGR